MERKKEHLIILCALGLLVALFPINIGATVIGTTAPASGDWVINNATVVTGETIEMTGSIIINDGGSLVLNGATIKMNCTTEGQYGITVKGNGAMTISGGSHITRAGSANYYFMAEEGASFSMTGSKLEYCGYLKTDYDNDVDYPYTGLYLKCDATIVDSVIDNCLQGLIAEDGTVTVRDTTVKNSTWHNIEGRNTKNLILDHSTFTGGVDSIKCNVEFYEGCTATCTNNSISNGGSNNIWSKIGVTATIKDNEIWGASKSGIWASIDCDLTIKDNIIRDNTRCGIWIGENSEVVCTGNTIKDNGILTNPDWDDSGHGFAAFDSDVVFSDNTVGNNYGHNFETTRCTATFDDNDFTASIKKCNVEFFDGSVITAKNNVIDGAGHNCFWVRDGVKGTIEGNIIKNSPHNGIWCGNQSDLTIINNVIENCDENGIYSYNSTLTITNNEFKNCTDWGIYTEGCTVTESGNTYTSVTKGEKYEAYFVQLKILDEDNAGLPDAAVTVKDSSGATIWSGDTDSNGMTGDIRVNAAETYTAEAKWMDLSSTMEFTPEKSEQIDLNLEEEEESDNTFLYVGIVVLVIIVILVIVLLMRKSKDDEDEKEEE